jgi:LysM repeat protein
LAYWGWRPLIAAVFISVLVVSCTPTRIAPTSTQPPTQYPPVTLTVRRSPAAPVQTAIITPTFTPSAATLTADTPAPSPTPILYIVQEGDTLLGIALFYGVDLAALQAANPGVDSRALSIGQQIIVPAAGSIPVETTVSALPTPTPLNGLVVSPPTCYAARGSTLTCLGVVQNPLNVPVERVAVEVQLGDARISAPLEQRLLPSGALAPYHASFPAPDSTTLPTAILLSADEAARVGDRFAQLRVIAQSGEAHGRRYMVEAQVMLEAPAADLRAVVAVFSADDNVLGYRVMERTGAIASGETVALRVDVALLSDLTPVRYTLHVEARRGG